MLRQEELSQRQELLPDPELLRRSLGGLLLLFDELSQRLELSSFFFLSLLVYRHPGSRGLLSPCGCRREGLWLADFFLALLLELSTDVGLLLRSRSFVLR